MQVSIYIPTESDGGIIPAATRGDILNNVKVGFAGIFGGYTAVDGIGGYVNDAGDLVEEKVTIVYAFGEIDTDTAESVRILARRVRRTLLQECVLITFGETVEFVRTFPVTMHSNGVPSATLCDEPDDDDGPYIPGAYDYRYTEDYDEDES